MQALVSNGSGNFISAQDVVYIQVFNMSSYSILVNNVHIRTCFKLSYDIKL